MRILNLYAGLGGNRKLWDGCDVVSVEIDPKIAEVYAKLYPGDKVVIGDAHEYLRMNFKKFDFIWTSPPCPTHSKMAKATKHRNRRYPDMALYQEILFLQHFFKGQWVVENVHSFYEPLIPCQKIGRHQFWSNFKIVEIDIPKPKNFIDLDNTEGKKMLMDWLGIHFQEKLYSGNNHCPAQVLRNCVHPLLGNHVYRCSQMYLDDSFSVETLDLPLFREVTA
jgi:DNA (cytosine-5)-methyltransferase 1